MEIHAVGLTVELIPTQLSHWSPRKWNRESSGVPFNIRIVDAQNYDAPLRRAYSQLKMNVRAPPM